MCLSVCAPCLAHFAYLAGVLSNSVTLRKVVVMVGGITISWYGQCSEGGLSTAVSNCFSEKLQLKFCHLQGMREAGAGAAEGGGGGGGMAAG